MGTAWGNKPPGDTPLFFNRLGKQTAWGHSLHFFAKRLDRADKNQSSRHIPWAVHLQSLQMQMSRSGRHDGGPSKVRNAGGVACNSLGCKPQGSVSAGSLNPEGVTHIATFSNTPASLSPLQGLDFWFNSTQGLAPLAIPFRPSGA